MKKNLHRVKMLPKAKGFNKILYPGERKSKTFKKNKNKNIFIDPKIFKEMSKLHVI